MQGTKCQPHRACFTCVNICIAWIKLGAVKACGQKGAEPACCMLGNTWYKMTRLILMTPCSDVFMLGSSALERPTPRRHGAWLLQRPSIRCLRLRDCCPNDVARPGARAKLIALIAQALRCAKGSANSEFRRVEITPCTGVQALLRKQTMQNFVRYVTQADIWEALCDVTCLQPFKLYTAV